MAAWNKIGFHLSPGGHAGGLGDWMRELDAAGIPFCVKGADTAGPVYEGQQLAMASGVPHVLIYRRSGPGWDYPDYGLEPAQAAQIHWEKHRAAFPPELDKEIVWLETINEVDKNRSDWMGHFACHTAELALRDGFRWAAFGWSSGEPEREHWETPGMLRYLALCSQHSDRLAVALHEYSYADDIRDGYPSKVGRFQWLFDVCDQYHIPRPTLLITEWGWNAYGVPAVDEAMRDIGWAAELYARHRNILGAAMWHLGGGYGSIAAQAQRLIQPVKRFTLETEYPHLPLDEGPLGGDRFDFVADVTVPDGAAFPGGASFVKTWRLKNIGDATWGAGYKLGFAGGVKLGAPDEVSLPRAAPGEEIDVSISLRAPSEKGTYRSYWQLRGSDGGAFGRTIWAEIEVKSAEELVNFDQYHFVSDVTIPDGTEIPTGEAFIKVWKVRNTGTTTWQEDYQLAFVSGTQMAGPLSTPIERLVPPDTTANIAVTLRAPAAPGIYHGNWSLRNLQGESFGEIMWVGIAVQTDVRFADGFHWPVGNRVNLEGWADVNPFLRRNGRGEYHPGADLNDMGWGDHDLGAPIYAAAHGVVTDVGFWPIWGNLILIEHHWPDGTRVWTQYAHCHETFVGKGDVIRRGTKIGAIGKGDQGRYWAHLHFEIRKRDFHVASWSVWDPEVVKGNYHDPMRYIREHFASVV